MKVKETDDRIIDYDKLQPEKDINALEQEVLIYRNDPNSAIDKKMKARVDGLSGIIHLRKVYAKNFAMEQEKNNHQYLIFVTAGKDLYKMLSYSALTFHQEVAKRIEETSNLMFDNDRFARCDTGVVTKKLSSYLFTKLESVGILPTNEIKYPGPESDVIVFKLPYEHSDEQLKNMVDQAELGGRNFNLQILPKNPYPNLYLTICDARDAAIDMDGHLRQYKEIEGVGEEVFDNIRKMFHGYLNMAVARAEVMPVLLEMKQLIILIKNDLKFIESSNKVKDKNSVHRVGEQIFEAEKIIQRLLKIQKKIKDEEKRIAKQDGAKKI